MNSLISIHEIFLLFYSCENVDEFPKGNEGTAVAVNAYTNTDWFSLHHFSFILGKFHLNFGYFNFQSIVVH